MNAQRACGEQRVVSSSARKSSGTSLDAERAKTLDAAIITNSAGFGVPFNVVTAPKGFGHRTRLDSRRVGNFFARSHLTSYANSVH